MRSRLIVPAICGICASSSGAAEGGDPGGPDREARYCIVGAGAAGLQLGHYLQTHGKDYVIWERSQQAGTWFRKYPIHRKLISINRRNTRSSNSEFNLRHDWNSLLDLPLAPFTNWTQEYFPRAEVLADYLQAAADLQNRSVLYEHTVERIRRLPSPGTEGAGDSARFRVAVQGPAGRLQWRCSVVVAAIGLWRPNVPSNWIQGMEHTVGYEELSPWPGEEAFDGLSVLILGNGNGAFETSDAVRNFASDIGIIGRREERFAMETHYVGDVRAQRLTSMDSLKLKSLDDVFAIGPEAGLRLEFLPCAAPPGGGGQGGQGWPAGAFDTGLRGFRGRPPVCALSQHSRDEFLLADHDPEDPAVAAALERWPRHIQVRNVSSVYRQHLRKHVKRFGRDARGAVPLVDEALAGRLQVLTIKKETAREMAKTSPEFREALPALMATTQGLYVEHDRLRKPFDVVIRALGWRMELGPFQDLNVKLDGDKKYPMVDACFESQSERNLYFAGTVTHGFDKRRFGSAGGFIHGFRYTTKSLFRCLMHAHEGWSLWQDSHETFPWNGGGPSDSGNETCSSSSPCAEYQPGNGGAKGASSTSVHRQRRLLQDTPHWNRLVSRVNEASGPYQMSCGALVDGIVYDREARQATYFQDMPLDLFEATFGQFPRLLFQYRYGKREDLDDAAILRSRLVSFASAFLHPVLFYMKPGEGISESSRLHLVEDRWTDFAGREEVLALVHFLSAVEAAAWSGSEPPVFQERLDKLQLTCDHHAEPPED